MFDWINRLLGKSEPITKEQESFFNHEDDKCKWGKYSNSHGKTYDRMFRCKGSKLVIAEEYYSRCNLDECLKHHPQIKDCEYENDIPYAIFRNHVCFIIEFINGDIESVPILRINIDRLTDDFELKACITCGTCHGWFRVFEEGRDSPMPKGYTKEMIQKDVAVGIMQGYFDKKKAQGICGCSN